MKQIHHKVGLTLVIPCHRTFILTMRHRHSSLLALATSSGSSSALASAIPERSVSFQDEITTEVGGVRNVHLTYNVPLSGDLSVRYGSCSAGTNDECHHALGRTHVGDHQVTKRHIDHAGLAAFRGHWAMKYGPSCKVALHYETRFWEHLPEPIYGGCGSTNILNIDNVCYPPYNINSTGPGILYAP